MLKIFIAIIVIVIGYLIVKEIIRLNKKEELFSQVEEAHEELLETEVKSTVMDVKEEIAHKKRVNEMRDRKLNS